MAALILIGLVVVIALAVVWSRVGLARSERRSMTSHKHTLQVLGDVARRSDKAAPITPLTPERATLGHIRTEQGGQEPASPPPSLPRITTAGRFETHDEPLVPKGRIPEVAKPQFEDDSDAFERLQEEAEKETVLPLASASVSEPVSEPEAHPRSAPPRKRPRTQRARPEPAWGRIGSVAAGVVILGALVFLGVHLAGSPAPKAAVGNKGPAAHPGTAHHHHRSAPTTTTVPSALVPVSTSSTDVAFVAPKGTYTLQLTDTGGVCWVGIQQTSGGPYLWEETLYGGQQASYKASGPLVVRIGAPKFLGVKVNGLPARLPGFVQPYDLTFNPASLPSSA